MSTESVEFEGVVYQGEYRVHYRGEDLREPGERVFVVKINDWTGFEVWGEPTFLVTHHEGGSPTGVVYPDELFKEE